jgi:outer membrane protein assembly factor BamA
MLRARAGVFPTRAFGSQIRPSRKAMDPTRVTRFYLLLNLVLSGPILCTVPSMPSDSSAKMEGLPILSYDTDVGFGYGVKIFFLDQFGFRESIDLTAFNSSKGERWYRLVFSLPDFELRQGTVYPIAVDLAIDYDEMIHNSFFGIGNRSRFKDREFYRREPMEITLTASRGFSPLAVGQVGLRYKYVMIDTVGMNSPLSSLQTELGSGRASYVAIYLNYRHDSRNSYINPSEGTVWEAEVEVVPGTALSNVSFVRYALWAQGYTQIPGTQAVLAARLGFQSLKGESIPLQFLLPIGGNQTLRGSPQDRFLDKTSAMINAELRLPIVWRL